MDIILIIKNINIMNRTLFFANFDKNVDLIKKLLKN